MTVASAPATVTEDLRRALDGEVARRTGRRVVSMERRPHPYRTSFPLEEVDLALDNGARLELVLKELGFDGLERHARLAKESGSHDPRREVEAYRLLDGADLGTPRLYGAVRQSAGDRSWLLIERIPGVPLWQVGAREIWDAAAAWLATLHRRFLGASPRRGSSLLIHDGTNARAAMRRAIDHASGRARPLMERIGAGYAEVADWLDQVPRTLVHGDFHASNILVDATNTPPRIAPVDWELAGVGPGLRDLASLTAGRWSEDDRAAIVAAYGSSAGRPIDAGFLADLDRCRLLNAVSLLGSSPDWLPPPEHEHDWLTDAATAAERLAAI